MRYSNKMMSGVALGAALLAAMPAQAATTVLDFSTGNVCGFGATVEAGAPASRPCSFNGDEIGTDYGSSDQLQVRYDSLLSGYGRVPFLSFNVSPTNVAYAAGSYSGMSLANTSYITFTPTAGQEVSFTSFDFAAFTAINGRFTLTSGGTTIFDVTRAVATTLGTYTANTSYFSSPLVFGFVGDNDGLRLDNITFDVRAIDATPAGAVPEPATWAMLLMGFGAMGYTLRRRPAARARIRFA